MRVQEDEYIACGLLCPTVPRTGNSQSRLTDDPHQILIWRMRNVAASIGRSVIHYHDFQGQARAPKDGPQRVAQELPLVVNRDYNGNSVGQLGACHLSTCDILIRSYHRDFPWLSNCLKSIEKYCHGFAETVLVVPASSYGSLGPLIGLGPRIVVCRDYRDDYLGQQVTKLHADEYCGADYICHVDSDCLFYRDVSPEDLILEEKPVIALTDYDELPDDRIWQSITGRFLGRPVHANYMRRQPMVFPRWIYPELRSYAAALHGTDLETYVISQPPRGFSEFNALGAYAYAFHRDRFLWLAMRADEPNETVCKWDWSWGGLTSQIAKEVSLVLSSHSDGTHPIRPGSPD